MNRSVVRLLTIVVAVGAVVAGVVPGASARPYRGEDAGRPWGPLTVLQEGNMVLVGDLASTSNGNTVVSWGAGVDGRYSTYMAARRLNQPWGQPVKPLRGQDTEFVSHGSRVTVGARYEGRFRLRTLLPDATWGPVRGVPQVPNFPFTEYVLTGNDDGDLAVWWIRSKSTGLVVRRDGRWQQPRQIPIGRGYVESLTMDRSGAVDVVYAPPINQVSVPRLLHVRRSPAGEWRAPTTLAEGRLGPFTVAANDAGALAVSWLKRHEGSYQTSLRLRYRPAGGAWGAVFERARRVPAQSVVGLTVAGDGQLAVAWTRAHPDDGPDLRFATRSSAGVWAPRQVLADGREIGYYGQWDGDLAGNARGQTALQIGVGDRPRGVEIIRCPPAGACAPPSTVPEVGYAFANVHVGPYGTTKLFWEAGCKGYGCWATSARTIADLR